MQVDLDGAELSADESDDEASGSDMDDDVMDTACAGQICTADSKHQPPVSGSAAEGPSNAAANASVVDEDGFQLVQRGRRRRN
jgi:hypothetical protein